MGHWNTRDAMVRGIFAMVVVVGVVMVPPFQIMQAIVAVVF